jgi:hypothetical protein
VGGMRGVWDTACVRTLRVRHAARVCGGGAGGRTQTHAPPLASAERRNLAARGVVPDAAARHPCCAVPARGTAPVQTPRVRTRTQGRAHLERHQRPPPSALAEHVCGELLVPIEADYPRLLALGPWFGPGLRCGGLGVGVWGWQLVHVDELPVGIPVGVRIRVSCINN